MNTTSERTTLQGTIPQRTTTPRTTTQRESVAARDISTAPSVAAAPGVGRADSADHEQLTLLSVPADTRATQLPTSAVHPRFQLNRKTREIGLAHVAEIRRQLAEAQAVRDAANVQRLPRRRTTAA
ncbi:MAG: hypothetical protein ACE37B_22385 [Ilumatobacter sp.]|uniref:hypothetical protein n=1 Tax=Ilumatobacter sp. TaxID=1967498 RepID=UPI003919965E